MITEVCINTVLFDLDGTIADTNEVILRALVDTLEEASGHPWSREAIAPLWGKMVREQLTSAFPAIDIERAIPFYRQRYAEHHDALLCEFPGIRNVLQALQRSEYRLGVVTGKKIANAQKTLADIGYDAFFSVVIGEEHTKRHKPAPEPLLLAIQQIGCIADTAMYIGDNPDDILAARAAGMRSAAVAWSVRPRAELEAVQPDVIIDVPDDLLRWLNVAG